ncbi:MAG TPA: NAD(P)H-dependent oxidoreductase [bacterium]|nr:NAD(P)H-dependent oxidoreductase [bacterium]HPN42318.1 NAD(P)H-dependent oxidoreductase [bacterium]
MNISLILAHPEPGSFNHAIARAAHEQCLANGHAVYRHDLYAERFDPVLPAVEFPKIAPLEPTIARYCAELADSDGIIIVHPNWWGQPPALLKGWIDRIIRPGIAYEFHEGDNGEGVPVGLLKARAALVFNTANTPQDREENVFGDPLQRIWKDCIFDLCGVKQFYREMFRVIVTSSAEQRREWLQEVKNTVNRYFPPQ